MIARACDMPTVAHVGGGYYSINDGISRYTLPQLDSMAANLELSIEAIERDEANNSKRRVNNMTKPLHPTINTVQQLAQLLRDPHTEVADVWVDQHGNICIAGHGVYADGWQAFSLQVPAQGTKFYQHATRTDTVIK